MINCQCSNIVKSTAITISGVNLRITIPSQSLSNGQKVCICLAQPIPASASTLIVQIVVGATVRPVITPCGNLLYSDQKYQGTCKTVATSRTVLCVKYASDNMLFVYAGKNRICPTALPFPVSQFSRSSVLDYGKDTEVETIEVAPIMQPIVNVTKESKEKTK